MFRDSVSLFTNKVKEEGDYDEVSSFFAISFKNAIESCEATNGAFENFLQDDFDHFENIQSTNWQTMRFNSSPSGFL